MSTRLPVPNRCPLSVEKGKIAGQCTVPLERLGDLLAEAKFERCGPISHYDLLKFAGSRRPALVNYCGREDLVNV